MEETLGNETTGRWKGPIKVVRWALGSLTMRRPPYPQNEVARIVVAVILVTFVIGLCALLAHSALRSVAFFSKAKADVRTLASAIE
jgi:hypothetical protein